MIVSTHSPKSLLVQFIGMTHFSCVQWLYPNIAFSMVKIIHDISAPLGQLKAIPCKSLSIPLCTCGGLRGGSKNEELTLTSWSYYSLGDPKDNGLPEADVNGTPSIAYGVSWRAQTGRCLFHTEWNLPQNLVPPFFSKLRLDWMGQTWKKLGYPLTF